MKKCITRSLCLMLILCLLPLSVSAAGQAVYEGEVLINELMREPDYGVADEDGDLSDWVELYNTGSRDIALKSFCLSDEDGNLKKWAFPSDAVIPAGGFYFLFLSGKNKVEEGTYFPHTSFRVPGAGGKLILSSEDTVIDSVVCPQTDGSHSFGRDPGRLNIWLRMPYPSPAMPNMTLDAEETENISKDTHVTVDTGVRINEVLASADNTVCQKGLEPCDYAELRNTSGESVDLSGWGLSDSKKKPFKWQFPEGTVLADGGYLCVPLDSGESTAAAPHASFSLSRTGCETLTLTMPDGTAADRVTLPVMHTDVSWGRDEQSEEFLFFDTPTPGTANGTGFAGYTDAPVFSAASGLYDGAVTVSITAPEGAAVYYTLDGSVPTAEKGTLYTGALTFSSTAVLRARAFSDTLRPSDVSSASYIMNTSHTLRVVSLIIDPDELWNENTGMLADGKNAVKEAGVLPFKNTVYRKYGKTDREAYCEIFEQDRRIEAVVSQGAELSLQGAYSLDMPQKSFKVKAKASLGEKTFDYPLFPGRPYTEYHSFVLRNSGNDCAWTRLVDIFQMELIRRYIDTDIITLDYEPCVVYLNGQYWGHYNMRERKDKYCIAQHENLNEELADGITIIKGNYTAVQGDNTEYKAMVKKLKSSSPNKKKADREYLDANVDVESYLDWFAIKMFFADSDPGNVLYYKLPVEGSKWKCLIFDMDYGMFKSTFDSPKSYMKNSGMGQQNIVNTVFKKILEVDEYRKLFFEKMGKIYQALTEDVMNEVLDEIAARLEPEMMTHFTRWAGDPGWKLVNSSTPSSAQGMYDYWQERIARLRNVIHKRPYYIYTQFRTQYKLKNNQMEQYFGSPCPEKPKDII